MDFQQDVRRAFLINFCACHLSGYGRDGKRFRHIRPASYSCRRDADGLAYRSIRASVSSARKRTTFSARADIARMMGKPTENNSHKYIVSVYCVNMANPFKSQYAIAIMVSISHAVFVIIIP